MGKDALQMFNVFFELLMIHCYPRNLRINSDRKSQASNDRDRRGTANHNRKNFLDSCPRQVNRKNMLYSAKRPARKTIPPPNSTFRGLPHRLAPTGKSGQSLGRDLVPLSQKYITSLPLKNSVQKFDAHSNGLRSAYQAHVYVTAVRMVDKRTMRDEYKL